MGLKFLDTQVEEVFECMWPEGDQRNISVPGGDTGHGYKGKMEGLHMNAALLLEKMDPNHSFIKRKKIEAGKKTDSSK